MNNPGTISLGDFTITTAGTQTGEWTETDLSGMLAMAANVRLAWTSGGTSITAYIQTAFDDVPNPVDIAAVLFGTASENAVLNFSALTPKTTQVTPTDGTLTNDTAVDGVLGSRFRLKVVSVGTYAGTVLSGRICAR